MILPASDQLRALQDVQSDRAATDHDHIGAGLDLRLAHRRANAGHHAAADDAGAIERHFLRHGDGAGLGHDGVLRMGGRHRVVMHLSPSRVIRDFPSSRKPLG